MNRYLLRKLMQMRLLVLFVMGLMTLSLLSLFVEKSSAIPPVDNHFGDLIVFDGT